MRYNSILPERYAARNTNKSQSRLIVSILGNVFKVLYLLHAAIKSDLRSDIVPVDPAVQNRRFEFNDDEMNEMCVDCLGQNL